MPSPAGDASAQPATLAATIAERLPLAEQVADDQIAAFHGGLLAWYAAHRRDLPWRQTRDPYAILLSEMMLQQTQVPRVLPRYRAWLERFPTPAALAAAPTADVLREWSGLGYNSRAVRLQQVARHVVAHNGGRMPETVEELLALPGIGAYTARAIACFAYERDVPVLDTNVKRVLHRVLAGPEVPRALLAERELWALAERAVPAGRGYDWHQGLMDFGSQVCTARRPACLVCPLRSICRAEPTIQAALAEQQGAGRREARRAAANGAATPRAVPFTSTNRHYRGQTLRVLGALGAGEGIALDALGPQVKPGYSAAERPWLYALVAQLGRDGLVRVWTSAECGVRNGEWATETEAGHSVGYRRDQQCAIAGVVREAAAPYDAGESAGAPDPGPEFDLTAVRVSLPEG
jgi:A/G-specific adenine glycosylase